MTIPTLVLVLSTVVLIARYTRDLERSRLARRRTAAQLIPAGASRAQVDPRLSTWVEDADLPVTADELIRLWVASIVVASCAVVVVGSAGVVVLVIAITAPPSTLFLRRGAADRRQRRSLPVFLDAVSSSLRAGASLRSAVRAAGATVGGRLGTQIERRCERIEMGEPMSHAFADWAEGPEVDHRIVGQVMTLLARHGGRGADALDRAAAVIRRRQDLDRERNALAAQARASAVVMTAAPVVFALVSGIIDSRTLEFLFSTPVGLTCLLAGVGLDAVGGSWMARITRRNP